MKIVDKTMDRRVLPGVPPYKNLRRVVQITRYRREEGNNVAIREARSDRWREH